jgi:hypothetical protein
MMEMRKIIHAILLFFISQTQALAKSIANVNFTDALSYGGFVITNFLAEIFNGDAL